MWCLDMPIEVCQGTAGANRAGLSLILVPLRQAIQ
jgi:hypothetical protein